MRKEYPILVLVALFWGSAHPIGKIVLNELTPLQLALMRSGLACVAIVTVGLATGRLSALRKLDRRSFLFAIVVGLFGFAFTTIFGNLALSQIPASVNALLLNTSPFFIALGAPFLLHERLTVKIGLGTLSALIGIFFVTFGNTGLEHWQSLSLAGIVLSLLGALAWALYTVAGRPYMKSYDAISITMLMSLSGAILLLVLVASGDGFTKIFNASLNTKLLVAYLGFVTTGLGFTLWYFCLKALPAASVGVFQYLIPVFAVLLSSVLLHEMITLPLVLGMFFIILGVRLVQAT